MPECQRWTMSDNVGVTYRGLLSWDEETKQMLENLSILIKQKLVFIFFQLSDMKFNRNLKYVMSCHLIVIY